MDNRLDFISNFSDDAINEMTKARKEYIEIDNKLREIVRNPASPALGRAVSLARTHLEVSLQYAIKSLCLLHEVKE